MKVFCKVFRADIEYLRTAASPDVRLLQIQVARTVLKNSLKFHETAQLTENLVISTKENF